MLLWTGHSVCSPLPFNKYNLRGFSVEDLCELTSEHPHGDCDSPDVLLITQAVI